MSQNLTAPVLVLVDPDAPTGAAPAPAGASAGVGLSGGLDLRRDGAGHRDAVALSVCPYVAVVGVCGRGEEGAECDEPGYEAPARSGSHWVLTPSTIHPVPSCQSTWTSTGP